MAFFITTCVRLCLALIAFVLLCFFLEVLASPKMYTHKIGRVVDATTGKGMPDVGVIAVATSGGITYLGSSAHNTLYRYITSTDANGDYLIPSMWSHAAIWLPFFNDIDVHWTITTLKPGYAIVGDEKAWDFREHEQGYQPASMNDSPSSTWLGFVVRVDPIRMYPVDLSLKAAGIYYRDMYVVGAQFEDSPEEEAFRKPTYKFLTQRICAVEPNAEIDRWTTEGLVALSLNHSRFLKEIQTLAPNIGAAVVNVRADEMCAALKTDGGGA